MRVLLATVADPSLFRATVPLAWALRTAGHDVLSAVPPAFCPTVTAAGLTAVPVGSARDARRPAALHPEQREALRAGLPSPYDAAGSFEDLHTGYRAMVERWHKPDNFPMIADLVSLARTWRPDLVLWEPTTFAAPLAAQACGAAHGRILWSLDVFHRAREVYLRQRPAGDDRDPLAGWLGGYARRHGHDFTEALVDGQFTVDPLPDSLALRTGAERVPCRFTAYGGAGELPRWLREPPDRPRVAVTLGLTATDRFAGHPLDVAGTLDALAELDAEIVATVRHLDGVVPAGVRVVSWAPLDALAATCDVVVDHAGPGTLLTVALAGVPQLTVPWDFDEPLLAGRIAAQGAALNLPGADGPAIRDGVRRLLTEPAFRTRAGALRAELLAMPTPNEIVPRLVELAEKGGAS